MAQNQSTQSTCLPILYSLRNCPYAMRARLAIFKTQQKIELRDIVLSNKPAQMLLLSPKGTVPVLVYGNESTVIDESLDIMLWALNQSDPDDLLCRQGNEQYHSQESTRPNLYADMLNLIATFDHGFKSKLEAYRCAKRYHENNLIECRQACEEYLQGIEERLNQHVFIMSNKESLADIALLPFIRQFAKVERQW